MVRGYGESRLDSAKVNVMVDFCGLHRLPLTVCIDAGRAWSKGGLKAAWAVLDAATEAEQGYKEGER
ncbi:MAG: hypothetical protein WKF67_06915 [Rubrobacteraceae bacterium]